MKPVRYRAAGFFMLRRAALPLSALAPTTASTFDADAVIERFRSDEMSKALLIASETLYEQVCARSEPTDRQRLGDALGRYLARMCTRATPFGAFAGVAFGRFVPAPDAAVPAVELVTSSVRPDMAWLLQYAKSVDERAKASRSVPLRVNDLLVVEGRHASLAGMDVHGEGDGRSARLRATAAFRSAVAAAACSATGDEVADRLLADFPGVDRGRATTLVDQLTDVNVLTSTLRPTLTSGAPGRHLVADLMRYEPTRETAARLSEVLDQLERLEGEEHPGRFVSGMLAARRAQDDILPDYGGSTVQVDAGLAGGTPTIPREVGREAAALVEVLMRMQSAFRDQQPHLTRYRRAFEKRYGVGVLVPVFEVLSPASGLDAPETYTEPSRFWGLDDPYSYVREETDPAVQAMCAFAVEGLTAPGGVVELSDAWLDRLAPPRNDSRIPFPVVDAYLELAARDADALRRGEWTLVAKSHSVALGGRTFGRFGEMLSEAEQGLVREVLAVEERSRPEAVFAELSYLPKMGRGANVLIRPLQRDHEIPVNVNPSAAGDSVVSLDDLRLGSDGRRLYLWSAELDREVVVTQQHMLTLDGAPNVCRLLLEVSMQGYVQPSGFEWGPMSAAPRLPRVVRGRTVLRVAQWNLPSTPAGARLTDAERVAALRAWLSRHEVPEDVYLVEYDNRILLRLTSEFGERTLLSALSKARRPVTLEEVLPGPDSRWVADTEGNGYVAEIVVPVVAAGGQAAPSQRLELRSSRFREPGEVHLPGSRWVYVKLSIPLADQDALLADDLPDLAGRLRSAGAVDRWFYIRYAEPEPVLRLRFRATSGREAEVMTDVLAWCRAQVEAGTARDLAVASYAPEVARYGGPRAMEAVERFFHANSEVSCGLFQARARGEIPGHLAVTVVAACDRLLRAWGLTVEQRLAAIPVVRESDSARVIFRQERDVLAELLSAERDATSATQAVLDQVLAAQDEAVVELARLVRALDEEGSLVGTVTELLSSLCHMQVNRLMPSGGDEEADCYTVWRRTLLAVQGRALGRAVSSGHAR